MPSDPIAIVSGACTPMDGLLGDLAPMTTPQLGSAALHAAISRGGLKPEGIKNVVMGCLLSAGQGQAPASRNRPAARL